MSGGGIGRFRGRNKPNTSEGQEATASNNDLGGIENRMKMNCSSLLDSSDFGNFGNFNTSFDELIPAHTNTDSSSFVLAFDDAQTESLFVTADPNRGLNDEALFDNTQVFPWNRGDGTQENNTFLDGEKNQKSNSPLESMKEKIERDFPPLAAMNYMSPNVPKATSGTSALLEMAMIDGKPPEDRSSEKENGNHLSKDTPLVPASDNEKTKAVPTGRFAQEGDTNKCDERAEKGNDETTLLNENKLNSSVNLRQSLVPKKGDINASTHPIVTGISLATDLKKNIALSKNLPPPSLGSHSLDSRKSSTTPLPALVTPSLLNRHESQGQQGVISQPHTKIHGISNGTSYEQRASVPNKSAFIADDHVPGGSSFVPNARVGKGLPFRPLESDLNGTNFAPKAKATPFIPSANVSKESHTNVPNGAPFVTSYEQRASVSNRTAFIADDHVPSGSSFDPNARVGTGFPFRPLESAANGTNFAPKAKATPFFPSANVSKESHTNVPNGTPFVPSGPKQIDNDMAHPKPITPATESSLKGPNSHADGNSPAKYNCSEGKSSEANQAIRMQNMPTSQSVYVDSSLMSTANTNNEDTIFDAANSSFRDETLQVYDIQNRRHVELVNLRVRLCMLEALVLDHHSSFDDLTDEIQLLLSQFPDSYDVTI